MAEESSEYVERKLEELPRHMEEISGELKRHERALQAACSDFFHRGPYAPPDDTASHGRE